ncbi:hypothetical protein INR49_025373, partial [Caranx melampygus]
MDKERKTAKLEKYEPDPCPIIVCEVKKSVPRMRIVKPKEKVKVTTSVTRSTTKKDTTTCETSGNIMRLCVNLMPVLASAKEPVEEEEEGEEKEEDISCTSEERPKTSSQKNSAVTKLLQQQTFITCDSLTRSSLDRDTEAKQSPSPLSVLPPVTPKPALQCCNHLQTKSFLTPLPPIGSSEKTTTISPTLTTDGCDGKSPIMGQELYSRPWIDNPLFSKSRSPEFRLPDISLSSLDALLQTVTQRLVRKRRSYEEALWGQVQNDHLLMAAGEQGLREKTVRKQTDPADIGAVRQTSVNGKSINRQRSLPPLLSTPKSTLILALTKKDLLTSTMLRCCTDPRHWNLPLTMMAIL